ncbi:MAG: hypothetical protein ACPGVG_20170, partial [Mycobacterium sp.]
MTLQTMPRVYVAGPFRADDGEQLSRHIHTASQVGFAVACAGAVPVIPHTMYRDYDRTLIDEFWLTATMELMHTCQALVMCPGWEASAGSVAEKAEFSGPVFGARYFAGLDVGWDIAGALPALPDRPAVPVTLRAWAAEWCRARREGRAQ